MTTDTLSATFAALADPTRRAILARLAQGEATVKELAEPFAMTLPAVSKHLKVLERAGLVTQGRRAQWRPCQIDAAPLREAADYLSLYRRLWEGRFDRLDNFLSTFSEGERTMTQSGTQENMAARTFTVERVFNAPREKVFAAFTECDHLMQWWGPHEWPLAHCDMDFRVGGSWHYAMRETATGNESWGLALYDEIKAPELIRYRDVFSDANRTINTEMPEIDSTLHFYAEGEKTRVVSRSVFASEDALRQILDIGMEQGLQETWDRLETYLAR